MRSPLMRTGHGDIFQILTSPNHDFLAFQRVLTKELFPPILTDLAALPACGQVLLKERPSVKEGVVLRLGTQLFSGDPGAGSGHTLGKVLHFHEDFVTTI